MENKIQEYIASREFERNKEELYLLFYTCEKSLAEYYAYKIKYFKDKEYRKKNNYHLEMVLPKNIVIVFSHLFLEAIIYDYCVDHFSDSYVKNHIDKMNFLSKWIVIPQLVTGKMFPTDSQAYQLLISLNKARNEIIHFKTKKVTYETVCKEIDKYNSSDEMDPYQCFECMREVLFELGKLDESKFSMYKWGFIQNLIKRKYSFCQEEFIKTLNEVFPLPNKKCKKRKKIKAQKKNKRRK